MASSWVWLCFSLLAIAGQPDWGSTQTATDLRSTKGDSGPWHLACSPGGAASFSQASGSVIAQSTTTAEYRAGDGHNNRWFFPGNQKVTDLTLAEGSDSGWIAAWSAQSAHAPALRDCTLSLMSTDSQVLRALTLHRAYPKLLDKSDRGAISKLVLSFESVDVAN